MITAMATAAFWTGTVFRRMPEAARLPTVMLMIQSKLLSCAVARLPTSRVPATIRK